jgi:uncharacterized protein (DUF2345 family)
MESDDDPEQRIRELERGLSDPTPVASAFDYHPGFTRPPGQTPVRWSWWFVVVGLVILVPIGLAVTGVSQVWKYIAGGNFGGGPITVARGGTLNVAGNNENKTIACNDGGLTLSANNSTIKVVGHCASLTMSGFDSHVNIENADAVEVSGFDNAVTETGCSDGKLTLSGYDNTLSVGGHCAGLTVSSYGNQVQADSVDTIAVNNYGNTLTVTGHCGSLQVSAYNNQVQVGSVDTVDVSGYSDTVTYHSGSPKVAQSGYDIVVKQG